MSTWLDAYIDGELDQERAARLDAHAAECPRCAASVAERRRLSRVIADNAPYRPAPASLRAVVFEGVSPERASTSPTRTRAPAWAWASLAAAVLLAAALAWTNLPHDRAGTPGSMLAREAVSAHIRSLMGAHLTDVATSDQHVVKPWFTGKLDFAPQFADHAAQGFPLVGGRLDYVDGRPAAALIYTRRAHTINLFTCPDPSAHATPVRIFEERGFNAICWSDGSMQYCAISDLSLDELRLFASLAQSSPGSPSPSGAP